MPVHAETVTLDPDADYPLAISAVAYTPQLDRDGPRAASAAADPDPDADQLTLVLLHATGAHKETWAPLVAHLFPAARGRVRDAWAIEAPNHGRSAARNERALADMRADDEWSGWAYPRAVHRFLTAGTRVDFRTRRLVGVGHSMGGNALTLLHALEPRVHFEALVLLEATVTPEGPEKDRMSAALARLTWSKRDTWPSRRAARAELAQAPGFKTWDARALDLFVEHGLRTHPAAEYPPPFGFEGVTLACSRAREAACYRADAHHPVALDILTKLMPRAPVHCILGETDDFGIQRLKEAQYDAQAGRTAASVTWIPRAGHMMVQQAPEATAEAIGKILVSSKPNRADNSLGRSRL